jgi:hypothetical protein
MDDRYKLDDEGNPIAEKKAAGEEAPAEEAPAENETPDEPVDVAALGAVGPSGDAAADGDATEVGSTAAPAPDEAEQQAALRRQVEQTLRFMRLQTAVGFVVLLILIVVLSDIRGVMILVTIVFLFTSLGAYAFLRRTLSRRVLGYHPSQR